jgi:hypothetical protein
MQTIVGNFVKNPLSPAPNWPKYVQGNGTNLAKLAYNGNVQLSNVVQPARSDSIVSVDSDIIMLYIKLTNLNRTGPATPF